MKEFPFIPIGVCISQEGRSSGKNPTFPTLAPFETAGFLSALNSSGIVLSVSHGRIRFDAPAGAFTQELRAVAVEQQTARDAVRIHATPCDEATDSQETQSSPKSCTFADLGDDVRRCADGCEQRRRWELNPRWRICNPLP